MFTAVMGTVLKYIVVKCTAVRYIEIVYITDMFTAVLKVEA